MKLQSRTVLAFLVLGVLGLAPACSSPAATPEEEAIGTSQSALSRDDDDAPPLVTVTVSGFDLATGTITGTSGGKAFSSTVASTTIVRVAPITNYYPNDPVRPLAAAWNALIAASTVSPATFGTPLPVNLGASFGGLLSQMATAGAHFRVKLNPNGTVHALRPVP